MLCAQCGTRNPEDARFCFRCGAAREAPPGPPRPTPPAGSGPPPPPPPAADPVVAKVIPYRNMPALLAYYCGVFGLIPCLGMLLGPVALILGIMGWMRVRSQPDLGGTAHAWVGMILGFLEGAGHVALILWIALSRP